MHIKDFFAYNNNCPLCNSILTKGAEIAILVQDRLSDEVALPGIIGYFYHNNRFHKNGKIPIETEFKKNLNIMYKAVPESFGLNKKFQPRIGVDNLSKLISPWRVYVIEGTMTRVCGRPDHMYYYRSQVLWDNEDADAIEFSSETMLYDNFLIDNSFKKNIGFITKINTINKYGQKSKKNFQSNEIASLPFIPMQKWNFAKPELIKSQIEKYILLK